MEKSQNRILASIQLAAIFCWANVVIGLLVANLVYVLAGILYAVSAVGLHRKRLWGARLAMIMSVLFGAIEIVLIILSLFGFFEGTVRYSSIPTGLAGQILRLTIHLGILFFVSFAWNHLKGKTAVRSDYEKSGTV